jgi:peptidoglycan-associated lipoprotein
MATCLGTNPSYTLIIEGHTDDRGTPSYNIALGQKRADAVKKYLMQMGVASNRIKTISYGEGRPIENEKNEYAWQQNRRAEFVLGKN